MQISGSEHGAATTSQVVRHVNCRACGRVSFGIEQLANMLDDLLGVVSFTRIGLGRVPGDVHEEQSPSGGILPSGAQQKLSVDIGRGPHAQDFNRVGMEIRHGRRTKFTRRLALPDM